MLTELKIIFYHYDIDIDQITRRLLSVIKDPDLAEDLETVRIWVPDSFLFSSKYTMLITKKKKKKKKKRQKMEKM